MDTKKLNYNKAITYPKKVKQPANDNFRQCSLPLNNANDNNPSNDVSPVSNAEN
jgi:hypothetical protein